MFTALLLLVAIFVGVVVGWNLHIHVEARRMKKLRKKRDFFEEELLSVKTQMEQ